MIYPVWDRRKRRGPLTIDQTKIGEVAAQLMDQLEETFGDDETVEIDSVMLIVSVKTGSSTAPTCADTAAPTYRSRGPWPAALRGGRVRGLHARAARRAAQVTQKAGEAGKDQLHRPEPRRCAMVIHERVSRCQLTASIVGPPTRRTSADEKIVRDGTWPKRRIRGDKPQVPQPELVAHHDQGYLISIPEPAASRTR